MDSSKEVIGSKVAANMVELGVISNIIENVDIENIKRSIIKRIHKGTENLNIAVFGKGIELFSKNNKNIDVND